MNAQEIQLVILHALISGGVDGIKAVDQSKELVKIFLENGNEDA
jgi:hypothetical protein